MARRSDRNTSFGSRARWTSSLKVSEPKSSVGLREVVGGVVRVLAAQSLMLRIASPEDTEPIGNPFLCPVEDEEMKARRERSGSLCGLGPRAASRKSTISTSYT